MTGIASPGQTRRRVSGRLSAAGFLGVLMLSIPASAAPAEDEAAPAGTTDAQTAAEAGDAAVSASDFSTALTEYKRAKELDPNLDIDEAIAQAHFGVGFSDYEKGMYEEALEHFQDAQGLYPSPNFHYNIGQCYEALERSQQAIDSYRAYLRAVPETPDRANIEGKIGRLEKRLSDAETAREEADNRRAATPIQPANSAAQVDQPKHPGRALIITGGVLTGLGAAVALGGGTAFGLRARSKSQEVDDVFGAGNPDGLTFDEAKTLDDDGRQAQTAQIITLVAGGAVTAVGIALMAVGLVEKNRDRNLAAAPSIGPDGAGFVLRGRF